MYSLGGVIFVGLILLGLVLLSAVFVRVWIWRVARRRKRDKD